MSIGVGMGDYNDVLLEQLSNEGDGFYAYIDDRAEAERLFVEDLTGSLQAVALDARAQVEFDGDAVAAYRLLGYENRAIDDDDFTDDSVTPGPSGPATRSPPCTPWSSTGGRRRCPDRRSCACAGRTRSGPSRPRWRPRSACAS